MMGKFFISSLVFALALSLNAQTYKVVIKSVSNKFSFPETEFIVDLNDSQMKGFESRIDAAGFSGSGFKPAKVIEQEAKIKYEKELAEELARTPEEKVSEALEKLENKVKRLESFLDGTPEKNGNGKKGAASAVSIPRSNKTGEAFRKKEEAMRALAEYTEFKEKVEKARRNKNLMKELIEKIDTESTNRLDYAKNRESVHKAGYPYGTYSYVKILSASDNKVQIDFEYAASYFIGWIHVDGNNNGNSINSVLDMEYVSQEIKNLQLDLGKPYCVQMARPVKKEGSLAEAQNATSIFADKIDKSKTPKAVTEVKVEENPLNADGLYSNILKDFRGKESEVVRAIITITKVN